MSVDTKSRTSAGRTHQGVTTYQQLRQLIVQGQLAPGTWIIESDIAERLGVSRTPVRAALQRLQQEGFISVSRRGRLARAAVAPLTRDDAEELFGIVGALEGFAAARTAALGDRDRAAVVAEMEALNSALLEAARASRPDPHRIFDLDTAFHHRYVHAAAGPRLVSLLDGIKPQAERYVRLYTSALIDEIGTSVQEHWAIVAAIDSADAPAAQDAVQHNWANASRRLSRIIDTLGERGSW